MSTRLIALGHTTLNNRFNALSFSSQTIFINNFYSTDPSILVVLNKYNKPAFENWKNWAEGKEGIDIIKVSGAPTATLTFTRYYYKTADPSRIAHSEIGEFTLPPNPQASLEPRSMESGGHGQRNLDYLAALGWTVNIVKTYPNGVRIGHIPKHTDPKKNGKPDESGIPQNGQTWFPSTWTPADIQAAGSWVLSTNRVAWDAILYPLTGTISAKYKGVKVMLLKTQRKGYTDDIGSIFPDVNQ
jgi:hypothetical protein